MANVEVVTVRLAQGVGFQLAIDPAADDPVTAEVRGGHFALPTSVETLLAGVPLGATVIDLGANIGTFAITAAAFGYNVLAVEASPHNAELLRESARLNGYKNLRVVAAAVTDHIGTGHFRENGPFGVLGRTDSELPGYVAVAATTVDELVRTELSGAKVGFVKMDIEGSEVAAVRGMARLLGGGPFEKPTRWRRLSHALLGMAGLLGRESPPVYYESNGHTLNMFRETPSTLLSALRELGYTSYEATSKRLVSLGEGHVQFQCVVDYLAVKRGLTGAWLDARLDEVTVPKQIMLALAEARLSANSHRAHAARTLALASPEILADSRVQFALLALKADPVADVSEAMGWFTAP